jgi:hypothetical protein
MSDKARAGTLLCVDSGCYSDYGVTGFFVVLKDFAPKAELDEFVSTRPEQAADYQFQEHEFMAALLAKGYLLEVPYGTMHLTDYSRASEFFFTPAASEPQ